MKLGIGTWTFPWAIGVPGDTPARPLGPAGLLARARELGVDVVQYADNLPLDRLPENELREIRRAAEDREIELGTRGIGREHLRRCLATAGILGSRLLRVVVDTADHRPEPAEVSRALGGLVADLERSGVSLAVENHDRFAAGVLAGIMRDVAHPRVGVCLDTVNSFGALEGPRVVVETLAPYVLNLHVKDFTIRRVPSAMGFLIEGCPAGRGRLDVPWLLETLRGAGRDPNAILELWTPREPDLATTIAREEAWAKESVAWLKTLMAR